MSECVVLQAKAPVKKRDPEQSNGVKVLLVSDDIDDIETLCHAMEQVAIHADVCSDIDSATRKLCHSKFEAMVVDLKDETRALELIKKPRCMTSHGALLVLAILNDSHQMPRAFRAGASFTLVKPFTQGILMHTLKAAYPLMVRERRRSYRCPIRLPVSVSAPARSGFTADSINISQGGMALASSALLRVGERVTLKFTLPDAERPARIDGEVCWTDERGRVGLEFVQIPATVSEQLQSWLAARLEECLPC